MFPNGELATPEIVLEKFPAVQIFTHIIETDENGEVMFACQNLSAMRTFYEVDGSLDEKAAIQAIQDILNTPTPVEPSPEERIAAALEYQNLLSM